MTTEDNIRELGDRIQKHHQREGQPLAFEQYLERFLADPGQQCRGAAHFIRDTFDHYGYKKFQTPGGERRRWLLFNAEFADGIGRVAGQEEAQNDIYRLLSNFVREGRVNRLILLHGPNGSAKTSIIRAIVQGMEHYAATEKGALYKYRWLFPTEKLARSSSIGFGGKTEASSEALDSFAHLPGEDLDAVLECELKDHPLLLIPAEQRQALFERLKEEGQLDPDFTLPEYLLHGDLCAQCRRIHDALLAAYGGDSKAVLRHIQIVRLQVSGRYRQAVATVEPQMHVDAGEQQLTASRSLASLPRSIAHLDLFQPRGPLVDANRGLLEYNDLLKRHIDTFKYLLVTCESSQVTLERSTLFLNTVFIGSTNEMLLDSFKEYADFASFKGRLELVRVPYLRRASDEVIIYEDQVPEEALGRHLAPHTLELAAIWAVLTRLRQPSAPDGSSSELKDAIREITPLQKALLYDLGEAPTRLKSATAREMVQAIPDMYDLTGGDYEGRLGASAREVRMLLMNAAQRDERSCVSPLGLFAEIRSLLADKSVYSFLQRQPEGDFLSQDKLLDQVDAHYLELLEEEAAEAMGLVTEASYQELFDRYVQHVSHWLRKEKLTDPVTGAAAPPSEELMEQVEAVIITGEEDSEAFRKNLISRVGADALESDRKGEARTGPPDYSRVFPSLFERMRDDFVGQRKQTIEKMLKQILNHLDGEKLDSKEESKIVETFGILRDRFGYCDSCAQEAMAYLLNRSFVD